MFDDLLRSIARKRGLDLPAQSPEPLAALDYAVELELKRDAASAFWKELKLPGELQVAEVLQPRSYRSTTKRKAVPGRDGIALSFATGSQSSLLDRADHVAVYGLLEAALRRSKLRALAQALNFAIVRGKGPRLAVILNVRHFDAPIVRGGKAIAEELQAPALGVGAAFLYLDPSGSDYYLEARRPEGFSFKRLFGPDYLEVDVDGQRLRYGPTSFSQVNEAELPTMVKQATQSLAPLAGRTLLDLYCGYGLFSLTLGREAARVVGVDLDGPAIEAARDNAKRLKSKARFVAGRVTAPFINTLDAPSGEEVVLLDPPAKGTDPGVVDAIARRRPLRVLHICCGSDEIPREIAAWMQAGYKLKSASALDLFAGTINLETFLSFSR